MTGDARGDARGGTRALALARISLNVSDLATAAQFYTQALGFHAPSPCAAEPALAALLGVRAARLIRLRRGQQTLELLCCDPPGAPYPPDRRSDDPWFQHCALATDDMAGAYRRLEGSGFSPISRRGPQTLPGGIVAYKFRDPDGHPLELIQFPRPDPRTQGGIDHSAIVVADVARSIGFYTASLGLAVQARQVNAGPAQAALDDLGGGMVDVVALAPESPAPHLELLGYHTPRFQAPPRPADIAATRLVFTVAALPAEPGVNLAGGLRVLLCHDPDGHALLLEQHI